MKDAGLFVILIFKRKVFEKSTCFLLAGLTKESDCMKKFRTVVSVIVMLLCAVAGLFLGASLNNTIGGCILGVLISGFACIIYVLDNQDNN